MASANQSPTWKSRAAMVGAIALGVSIGTAVGDHALQSWRTRRQQPDGRNAAPEGPLPGASMPGMMFLPVGAAAPDLDLAAVDGGERFRLSGHRGLEPVVLVFGSFTCDLLQPQIAELGRIYRRHEGRVAFAFIAVREAGHRLAGYEFLLEGSQAKDPRAATDERRRCVGRAMAISGLPLAGYLDSPDHSACEAYKAWPRRLVVVDRAGRIASDFGSSLLGPWDMGKVEDAIRAQEADPARP
jgi:hypothetical protein